jgi:hypothetical protein
MERNSAVIVEINDYDEISPLNHAKSDAERMRDYLMQDLGEDKCGQAINAFQRLANRNL